MNNVCSTSLKQNKKNPLHVGESSALHFASISQVLPRVLQIKSSLRLANLKKTFCWPSSECFCWLKQTTVWFLHPSSTPASSMRLQYCAKCFNESKKHGAGIEDSHAQDQFNNLKCESLYKNPVDYIIWGYHVVLCAILWVQSNIFPFWSLCMKRKIQEKVQVCDVLTYLLIFPLCLKSRWWILLLLIHLHRVPNNSVTIWHSVTSHRNISRQVGVLRGGQWHVR